MTIHYQDESVTVHHGDALDVLRELPAESIDAVVCDPPAGISFMGREWDHHKGGRDQWVAWLAEIMREALRVVKPGAHALVWALPRTSGWTSTALEDAGWEVRDCLTHLFGSGFPKSLDVSKAIDKAAGAERQVVGLKRHARDGDVSGQAWAHKPTSNGDYVGGGIVGAGMESLPATDDARTWQGWGTALKPAAEHWWLARKPLAGTVAANVLRYGTGALNVDACRVGTDGGGTRCTNRDEKGECRGHGNGGRSTSGETVHGPQATTEAGRWPPNVILDQHAAAELDRQSGTSKDGVAINRRRDTSTLASDAGWGYRKQSEDVGYGGEGGASRFFPVFRYEAKAPTSERPRVKGEGNGTQNYGGYKVRCCDECGKRSPATGQLICGHDGFTWEEPLDRQPGHVSHPTVKPLALMRWLVRLVTPPNGVILDPFAGSGTTGEAAILEHFRAVLVEREADYLPLITARLSKPMQVGFDWDGAA